MKNQYLVIAIFMAVSMIACGNSTETEESTSVSEEVEQVEAIAEDAAIEEEVEVSEESQEVEVEAKPEVETPKVEAKGVVEEFQTKGKPVVVEAVRPKHDAWDALTKKYVASSGKVNYKGMKADINKISTYLEHLKNTSPESDWSKNEKLAYWINLYNASTVHLIVSNYPVKSITKLSGGKPWDKKFVKSGTKVYSLNDIENTIVRPQFKDPRIHAALNCAAVSCPKLLSGAFLPSKLNAQLDKQTKAWINDASKNSLAGDKAQVSQIFDWYKEDFKRGVIFFINKYSYSKDVAVQPNAKITYKEYDWALNE